MRLAAAMELENAVKGNILDTPRYVGQDISPVVVTPEPPNLQTDLSPRGCVMVAGQREGWLRPGTGRTRMVPIPSTFVSRCFRTWCLEW